MKYRVGWNESALSSYLAHIKSRSISQIDVWWCPPTKTDPRVNISATVVSAFEAFAHATDTAELGRLKSDDTSGLSAAVPPTAAGLWIAPQS